LFSNPIKPPNYPLFYIVRFTVHEVKFIFEDDTSTVPIKPPTVEFI